MLVSDSLLFSRLDCWTPACEDANSKLVEVVTVADAEKRVSDSLVQIWRLMFGHEAKSLFRF